MRCCEEAFLLRSKRLPSSLYNRRLRRRIDSELRSSRFTVNMLLKLRTDDIDS
jgi:hypothetical protein